jgi:hypothetical protein
MVDVKITFYTQYNHVPALPEENSGEVVTEQAGYVPPKYQIEQMMAAGQRLADYREEMFDSLDGDIPDDFDDPTRRPGFDLVDAGEIMSGVRSKVKKAKSLAKEDSEPAKGTETAPEPQKQEGQEA